MYIKRQGVATKAPEAGVRDGRYPTKEVFKGLGPGGEQLRHVLGSGAPRELTWIARAPSARDGHPQREHRVYVTKRKARSRAA